MCRKTQRGALLDSINLQLLSDQIDYRNFAYLEPNKRLISIENLKLGAVLTTHPTSHFYASNVRQEIKLGTLLHYPFFQNHEKEITINSVLKDNAFKFISEHFSEKQIQVTRDFLKTIKFDPNFWIIPYLVWILTGKLPVYPEEYNIEFSTKPLPYPAIYIKTTVTRTELKQWVLDVFDNHIEPYLPQGMYPSLGNTSIERIYLGCYVFKKRIVENNDIPEIISDYEEFLRFMDYAKRNQIKEPSHYDTYEKKNPFTSKDISSILTYIKEVFKLFAPLQIKT